MISVTPYLKSGVLGEYDDKILELYKADSALNENIPDSIRGSVEWLLRLVNCYYSNKIEGNPTHPKELLSTQEKDVTNNKSIGTPNFILELLVHIEAQIKAENTSTIGKKVTSETTIKSIHASFYDNLPEETLAILNQDGETVLDTNGDPITLIPGEYRTREVKVGQHIPPEPNEIGGYMRWIESSFNPDLIHGTNRVLAAAGLHHRLAWIHPFMDGNGRAIRLITDCYMRNAGFGGYGLWSITRGFGRNTSSYYKALAQADTERQGDTDGRGILSEAGLVVWTKYFINTALDQIKFFTDLLEPRKLNIRVDYYFELRAKGGLPDSNGQTLPLLKITARDIYRLILEKGSMSRSAICQHLSKGEQTLRPIFKQMHAEGLISAEPKKNVEVKLPPFLVEYLFPQIW